MWCSLNFNTFTIFIVTTIWVHIGSAKITYKPTLNDTGLYFYDADTNRTLLPPIVTPLKYTPSPRLPIIGRPCSCNDLNCGCCAGVNFQQFNFRRRMCTNFTYDPNEFSIMMDVKMNENTLYQNMVSAKNPEPICIPMPYVPVGADMCIKLFNIFTPGRNLHMCMDMQARIAKAPVIVLHFDCMRMGENGFALVKPDQNGGLDLPTAGAGQQPIPSPISPAGAAGAGAGGGVTIEPPQIDTDVYDEITEIKIN